MFCADNLSAFDPEIAQAIEHEAQRQEDHIELIAYENYTSKMVMTAPKVCDDQQIC